MQPQKITENARTMLYMVYTDMSNSREYCEGIIKSKEEPIESKNFAFQIRNKVQHILTSIDIRIHPDHKESFRSQVKNNDSLKIKNSHELLTRMTPEQQECIETCCEALLKGQLIFEKSES